jgi:hypothetical protein
MEGNGNIPYFRYALEKYMRRHDLEACDPCSLPAYILTGLLREAKERRAQHDASPAGSEQAIPRRFACRAGTITVEKDVSEIAGVP